jgi:hypothetical protein
MPLPPSGYGPIVLPGTAGPYYLNIWTVGVSWSTNDAPYIEQGKEYIAFILRIDGTHAAPPELCAGCTSPVCLFLDNLALFGDGCNMGGPPGWGATTSVGWQCGQGVLAQGEFSRHWSLEGCNQGGAPCLTPARNMTWGSIKSLYR